MSFYFFDYADFSGRKPAPASTVCPEHWLFMSGQAILEETAAFMNICY
jgi:hypothetical protein